MGNPLRSLSWLQTEYILLLPHHRTKGQFGKLAVQFQNILLCFFRFFHALTLKGDQLVFFLTLHRWWHQLLLLQLELLLYLLEIDALAIDCHAFFGLRLILGFNICLSLLDHRTQFFVEVVFSAVALGDDLLDCLLLPERDAG